MKLVATWPSQLSTGWCCTTSSNSNGSCLAMSFKSEKSVCALEWPGSKNLFCLHAETTTQIATRFCLLSVINLNGNCKNRFCLQLRAYNRLNNLENNFKTSANLPSKPLVVNLYQNFFTLLDSNSNLIMYKVQLKTTASAKSTPQVFP